MKRIIQRTTAVVLGLMLGAVAWGGLETVTHIQDLNAAWPLGSDLASTSDDHVRNIKSALKTDFPNFNGTYSSATAPVFAIPNDTNTGMYGVAADDIGFSTGGTLRFDIGLTAATLTLPITAASFVPSSSTIPANGTYLPSANTIGFATNSAQRWTINSTGTLSSAGVGTNPGIDINSTNTAVGNPSLRLFNSSASAQTLIDFFSNGSLSGRFRNDFAGDMAYVGFSSGGHDFFTGGDSGTGTDRFSIAATAPFVRGYGTTAAGLVDMTPDTGTFTCTYTGMSGATTGTCTWSRIGKLVMLNLPSLNGTSNTTAFTITGLPAVIQPAALTQNVTVPICINNGGATVGCTASVAASSGTITMALGVTGLTANAAGWTNTSAKGTLSSTISYLLN